MSLQTGPDRRAASSFFSVERTAILAFILLWCMYWCIHSWGYWEDDAFIHLEFARSLSSGRGFAFNGAVVYGDTAPFWVLLLSGMHLLISNWIVAGKVLAILGVVLSLTGVYAFSRKLAALEFDSRTFSLVMVLLFVVNPYFCYWSFSGMESIFAAGLALWAVVLATEESPSWSMFFAACLLVGIAPLVRPEMTFLAGILFFPLAFQWYRHVKGKALWQKFASFFAALILGAAPVILWMSYALHAFGHAVPNTNAAKRALIGASVVMRLVGVYALGYPIIFLGLLAGAGYLLVERKKVSEAIRSGRLVRGLRPAGWVFILWSTINAVFYIANHTYVQTRYVLVAAPGLVITVFFLLRMLAPRLYRVGMAGSLVLAIVISAGSVRPFIRNKAALDAEIKDFAQVIRTQVPPDALVADYSIGEVAFYSEHPILDIGGITRPEAIPYLNQPPAAMLAWIHSEGAPYYVTSDKPETGAEIVYQMSIPFIGWSLLPSRYSGTDTMVLWKLPNAQQVAGHP